MLGTSIGNYTVTAKIGEGGMGTVYVAEHAMLGRRAAVKVLLPELSHDRDAVARLFNEARAATAIRHPSIVEMLDFGYLPDASAYIVMEWLPGESLAVRCGRVGRLDPARALALVRQIAGALAAAHDCGIVHRDLKPDNVFVVPDPEVPGGERIKILDFGIAKLAGDARDGLRTQTGAVIGTPTYMAPEQCRGAGQIDARADLYALGCVLYELVCGRPPFTVDGAGELIAHHLYFEPEAPRTWEPALPPSVDRLILWLLRKEPGARPQTARELVEAIDRLDLGTQPGRAVAPQARPAADGVTKLAAHATTLSAASGVTAAPRMDMRRRWLIAAVAVTTVAIGFAIYGVASHGKREVAPASATSAASATAAPVAAVAPATASPPVTAPVLPAEPRQPPPAAASASTATASPAAAAQRPGAAVRLAVDSEPRGAVVLVDGVQIGSTPLDERVAAGDPDRVYTLRKDGYEPATVTLATAHDAAAHVVLKKRVVPKPAAAPPKPPPSLGDKGINPFDH